MNILDIAIAKKLAGGGGGSGTDNYNDLSNLPKINDTTLSGNKSSSALGLQSEINSDSKLASDLVDDTNQDNKFVTSTEKNTWNGKQNAIDSDHKLSSDLVDDANKTNKFVTSTEKNTWNNKQNAIDSDHKLSSDLVDDANKTNKFVTSTEKNTWNAKQNAIDSDHKLSSSLVSFSTAEAAALASGIDSTKVGQISTNQTNISYVLNRTGKNIINIQAPTSTRGCTFVEGNNGAVTITNTENWSQFIVGNVRVKPNTQYKLIFYTDAISNLPAFDVYPRDHDTDGSSLGANFRVSNTGTIVKDFTSISDVLSLNIYPNNQATTVSGTATFRVMVCEKTLYDLSNEYTWGIPNYDLTRLESEDRASLAEVVDSGAKNKFTPIANTQGGITAVVNSDNSLNITWTAIGSSNAYCRINDNSLKLPVGTYVLSGLKESGTLKYYLHLEDSEGNVIGNLAYNTPNGCLEFTVTDATRYYKVYVGVEANTSAQSTAKKIYPMICTKAAFGVSQKFVPYRPDYQALVDKTTEQTFGIFKYNNNYSITAVTRKCNGFAWFTLSATSTANIAANTNTIIGFVDADVQPAGASTDRVIFTARVNTDPPSLLHSHIRGGDGYIYINSPTAIPAGTSISITGSYKY